jgi:hypothetical protein
MNNMAEFVQILYRWQTIVGAFLGGFFAIIAALIVAYSARRREEIASAMLLVGTLAKIRITNETLTKLAAKENVPESDYPLWLSEKLVLSRPTLSPLFEASIVRIMPISIYLAAHLNLFNTIYSDVLIILERLSEDFKLFNEKGQPIRSKEQMQADARIVSSHFHMAVQHALCAEQSISNLVLSKVPTYHRFRNFILPKPYEKECMKLLRKDST